MRKVVNRPPGGCVGNKPTGMPKRLLGCYSAIAEQSPGGRLTTFTKLKVAIDLKHFRLYLLRLWIYRRMFLTPRPLNINDFR